MFGLLCNTAALQSDAYLEPLSFRSRDLPANEQISKPRPGSLTGRGPNPGILCSVTKVTMNVDLQLQFVGPHKLRGDNRHSDTPANCRTAPQQRSIVLTVISRMPRTFIQFTPLLTLLQYITMDCRYPGRSREGPQKRVATLHMDRATSTTYPDAILYNLTFYTTF